MSRMLTTYVCSSGQFALKRAIIDGSPHQMQSALQGHFGFAEGLAKEEMDYIHTIYKYLSLEIVWTEPKRLHDAKSEWRRRVTIAGYC